MKLAKCNNILISGKIESLIYVLVKLNSDDFIESGFTQSEMLQVSAMLESAGIDAIELSGGTLLNINKYSSSRIGKVSNKKEEIFTIVILQSYIKKKLMFL